MLRALRANGGERDRLERGWRRWLVAALAAALTTPAALAQLAPAAHAASGAPEFVTSWTADVQEQPVPNQDDWPEGITVDNDGNIWFAEGPSFFHKVAKATPAGVITEFQISGSSEAMTAGPANDPNSVWFTEGDVGKVGRIDTHTGAVTEYPATGFGGFFAGITASPDGGVWVTGGDKIGRIDPSTGALVSHPVSGAAAGGIVSGPDGNLWFSDFNFGHIGQMTPAGVVTLYPIPSGQVPTLDITAGPDGNLWFTEGFANRVGRITTAGVVAEFPVPTSAATPWRIAPGPDGNVWFTEMQGNRIGRITPSGAITEVHALPDGQPFDLVTGADGKIWYTKYNPGGQGKLGRFDPATLQPPAPPCLVVTRTTTLTRDVGPCHGDGILVTASNVTLNLNGHKVVAAPDRRLGDFAGIHLLGVNGVQVTGGSDSGTVTGFDAGVLVDFGSGNTVKNLKVLDNRDGGDVASNLGDGIVVIHSSGNLVTANQVVNSGMFDGMAVIGLDSNNNRLQGNTVKGTTDLGKGQGFDGLGVGIIVNPFLEPENPRRGESISGNAIVSNTVVNGVSSGISNLSNLNATIRGNRVIHNGWRPNGDFGNAPGTGIGIQNLFFATPETRDVLEGNVVTGNASNGTIVFSQFNRVKANTFTTNGDNGIDIEGQNNQILDNTATGNDANRFGSFDLFDDNYNPETFEPTCDSNTWSDNKWGRAGYFPDCASGVVASQTSPTPQAASPQAASAQAAPHAASPDKAATALQGARGRSFAPPKP